MTTVLNTKKRDDGGERGIIALINIHINIYLTNILLVSFKSHWFLGLDSNLFAGQEEEQKFVVLEFGNGGPDLEHVELKNAEQGLAVFYQVAHALAGEWIRIETLLNPLNVIMVNIYCDFKFLLSNLLTYCKWK